MHLVDLSPEAAAVREATRQASDRLGELSLEAGALAGLLQLISHSEQLGNQEQMAVGALADMAQRLENEIEAVRSQLGEAGEAH